MANKNNHNQEILALCCPQLMSEWDLLKNAELCSPNEVTFRSSKKVWWKCKEGHEWQAIIHNRSINHSGCPYCAGRKAIKGVNDISTLYPDLVKEWDFEKNGSLKPDEITRGTQVRKSPYTGMFGGNRSPQQIIDILRVPLAGIRYHPAEGKKPYHGDWQQNQDDLFDLPAFLHLDF